MRIKYKQTLRRQMLVSFSTVFILLIIIFGACIQRYNIESYQDQSYEYCRKIVKANIRLIDNYFEQLQNMVNVIAEDGEVAAAVSSRNRMKEVDYTVELYHIRDVSDRMKQMGTVSGITNALIIGDSGEYLYYYGSSPVIGYHFLEQDWYKKAVQKHEKQVTFLNMHDRDYLLNNRQEKTVSLLRPIMDTNAYLSNKRAWLLCDFRLAPVLLEKSGESNLEIAIFDGTKEVYFPGEVLDAAQKEQLVRALEGKEESFFLEKTAENPMSYLVVQETSGVSGWSILGIMPLEEMDRIRTTVTSFVAVLLAASCMLILLLSGLISRSIMGPVNQLIGQFRQIADGKRKMALEETRSVEVNEIAHTASEMLTSIERLSDEVLREQQKLSEEQFKALQHQINPHFLNNVLQSVKAMALCGRTEDISRTVTLLGKMLSYSVYNPYDRVCLREELSYVEAYIQLQNIRLGNRIVCETDCVEEILAFEVPKLILQPIVENAIEHGFTGQHTGKIIIAAEDTGEEIYLAVSNDGACIGQEQAEELNRMLRQGDVFGKKKSIGLLNVNWRLKCCFGKEAGIRILSREGRSTSIILSIPRTNVLRQSDGASTLQSSDDGGFYV